MLIKKTRSLCPTCHPVIDAEIVEEEGKIWLNRICHEHGKFQNLYWSDPALYHRFDQYDAVGNGIANPQNIAPPESCPTACGLCNNHHSQTLLANIDLTNRCNLNCDFCFANARACGFVYEPAFDEVVWMLKLLRDEKPVPAPAVQFSGGEPTMREDLSEIIRKAKEMGFPQVQIATNGVRIAQEPGLCTEAQGYRAEYGLSPFRRSSPETNPCLKIHQKAIENLKSGPSWHRSRPDRNPGKK